MITIRRASDRFHTKIDWLDSHHSFSFGEHFDPKHVGFRTLRVINDDRVAPGAGFGTHAHHDMEILSYVLSGQLEHKDSIGTGSVIRPGDVQRMTAGTGVRHSEYNPSPSEPVHFLQIWLQPERRGLLPSYEQRSFAPAELKGQLRLIAARDGRAGAVTIHQDVDLYAALLGEKQQVSHRLRPGRHAWLQVAAGSIQVNGTELGEGDGAGLSPSGAEGLLVTIEAKAAAEVLLFDLA
jgi:redox-sensitive bicupin YhaK (pirin superfamily)